MAAQFLSGQGFQEIYNLKGGIMAWQGLKAFGPVELNLDLIRGDETPPEMVALAYGMEEALRRFYAFFENRTSDGELRNLFATLASVEEKHKAILKELLLEMPEAVQNFSLWEEKTNSEVLEGGFRFTEFIGQNEPLLKSPATVLETALMLETQTLDLYLRFAAKMEDRDTKNVLFRLGDEEKAHLAALGRLLDGTFSTEKTG